MRLIIIFLFVAILCPSVFGLKFLIYNPKLGKSLIGFMNKLGDILVEGGHEVVHYMPEVYANTGNSSNSKNGRIIERKADFLNMPQVDVMSNLGTYTWLEDGSIWDMRRLFKSLSDLYYTSCSQQLQDEKLMEMLRAEKFDLGFTDFLDVCGYGIFEKIGLKKYIAMYSTFLMPNHATILGIPSVTSYVPDLSGTPMQVLDNVLMHRTAEAFKENGINVELHELMGRSSYFFVNTDEHVDFPQPVSHKIVHIGGLRMAKAMEKVGKLDEKIQQIFDNSQDGVIYVSFGSFASSCQMPNETKLAFLKAFTAFPRIQFLWKYECPEDPLVQRIPNLHISKWWPQKELFAQKNLLAFVSHSGMNSVSEAAFLGVPMICIPLFDDQPRNAMMVETRGIGLVLNKHNLKSTVIVNAFREIVHNKKYKQNAVALSKMIHQKPMSPDERVLKYSEHAAKFDIHSNLDLPGRKLNTITFYNLDVWALILGFGSIFDV